VRTKADLGKKESGAVDVATSILTGEGLSTLRALLETRVRALLPPADAIGLNARHRERVGEAVAELLAAREQEDALFVAEHLRLARLALDRITGRAGVEDMLDALFGRFCIGK
jgi:tRNA modification GTPase